jgi:hypothetical protein
MIPSLTYTFHEHDPVQFTPWVSHHLVVPPPLPVELLRGTPALAVHLTKVLARRPARHEELRLAQQLLDRFPGREQRCQQVTALVAGLGQVLPVIRDRVSCDWLGQMTPLVSSATAACPCCGS